MPGTSLGFSSSFYFLAFHNATRRLRILPDQEQTELEKYVRVWSMTGIELKELIFKAQSGDAEAQYWVGVKCQENQLEPMDPNDALVWFLKSAQQDFAPAQRRYGRLIVNKNPPEAERWLLRAAEARGCRG